MPGSVITLAGFNLLSRHHHCRRHYPGSSLPDRSGWSGLVPESIAATTTVEELAIVGPEASESLDSSIASDNAGSLGTLSSD